MRCIRSRIVSRVLGLGLVVAATCAAPAAPAAVIDDSVTGEAMLGRFEYFGHWQHVHDKHDGRAGGTSTRSTHAGDVAVIRFSGPRLRLYGVRGPSGGLASVALDDKIVGKPIDFYAKSLQPHALVFESRPLDARLHTVSVAVLGMRNPRAHYYYVNIDSAEVDATLTPPPK